jgi:GLPGLI family protein
LNSHKKQGILFWDAHSFKTMNRLFLLILLGSFFQINAQTVSWEASYDFHLNLGLQQTYHATLHYGQSTSLFRWGKPVAIAEESGPYEFHIAAGTRDTLGSYTYADLDTGQLRSGIPHFNGKRYRVCEPIPEIQWEISSKTRDIGSFHCVLATGFFRGREYQVWFAPDFPVRAGPWKLFGLPGLVILARDLEDEIIFRLNRLTESRKNIFLPESAAGCIGISDFAELQRGMAAEMLQRMNAKLPRGSRVSLGKSNTMERFEW